MCGKFQNIFTSSEIRDLLLRPDAARGGILNLYGIANGPIRISSGGEGAFPTYVLMNSMYRMNSVYNIYNMYIV